MSTIVTRAGKGSSLTHNEVDANFVNLNTDKVEKSGTDPVVISANSTSDALRITQAGTGNALVVEDSANPDSTPFVVNASGNVGVGTTVPGSLLDVVANNTGLTSRIAGNTLRFTDTDTTAATNQPIGVIEFYSTDSSTGGTGVSSYILSAAASSVGGGDLVFGTAPIGSSGSPVERLRFESGGDINMAATSSLQKGGVDAFVLKNVTYLTSGTAATYTTPTGVRALKVTVVGGGGGGGGTDGAGASTYAVSSGGAGGGWAEALITPVESSYTYTVGAAGTGAIAGNNDGVAGGSSEFKNGGATVVISATGGAGGDGGLGGSSSSAGPALGGIGSLTGVTGIIAAGAGTNFARVLSSTYVSMGFSGGSKFGGGQAPTQPGSAARVYGEGGGSTYSGAVTTNYAGGNGFQGVIIVEEYY